MKFSTISEHCQKRMQQRCINETLLDALFTYGRTTRHRNCNIYTLNRTDVQFLMNELGITKQEAEKLVKYYAVEQDGEITTVAIIKTKAKRWTH